MCGIAGWVGREPATTKLKDNFAAQLRHRGPDGEDHHEMRWQGWHFLLSHARLAIIDIPGGHQPMADSDGSVVVFNGEIFNFLELREQLANQGADFKTKSDTEVLLKHLQKGRSLDELNGMYAFAYWSAREEKFILARDPAGIKPLYWAELPDGGLAFASELSALLKVEGVDTAIDPQALSSYFFSDYIHAPRTIVKGVKKLAPGETLTWKNGQITLSENNWVKALLKVSPHENLANTSEDDLLDQAEEYLARAVKRQLTADVPVGIFLSGGIDSSLLAALAQRQSRTQLQSFTIGFSSSAHDESYAAQAVAQHLGLEHHTQIFNEADLLSEIDNALKHLDEPLADSSLLPTFLLSRVARQKVKVVLGGDAGDELFAGYPVYQAERLARKYAHLPRLAREKLFPYVLEHLPQGIISSLTTERLNKFIGRFDKHPGLRHIRWMASSDIEDVRLLLPNIKSLPDTWLSVQETPNWEDEAQAMRFDFQTYMPGSILTKVDRASMSNGLEARPPFLDQDFVRFAFRVPIEFKLRGKTSKYLLRRLAQRLLPDSIINRPKQGFSIPLNEWTRTHLSQRINGILKNSPLWEGRFAEMLDQNVAREWFREHQHGRKNRGRFLWALIVLDRWARR